MVKCLFYEVLVVAYEWFYFESIMISRIGCVSSQSCSLNLSLINIRLGHQPGQPDIEA